MRLMQLSPLALIALLGLVAVTSTQADVMNMKSVGDVPADVQLPTRASTMEQVKSQFGEPNTTQPAVGDPPISRWVYPGFTVYFEHDRVIHSVVSR